MIPDLDLQRMRDHDETCDRLAPEGYKHCPPQYGVQAIFDRNRLLKELDLQSAEGAAKDSVISAARLVYEANSHEQVQRHIRRMGDKIMQLDSVSGTQQKGGDGGA